jgi:hypothetical protein
MTGCEPRGGSLVVQRGNEHPLGPDDSLWPSCAASQYVGAGAGSFLTARQVAAYFTSTWYSHPTNTFPGCDEIVEASRRMIVSAKRSASRLTTRA